MLTTDQILAGLAAFLGQMIGRMPAPEFFIPALVVFFNSHRARHVFVFSIFGATVGTIVFALSTGRPDYAIADFLVRYIGTVVFCGSLHAIRALFRKARRPQRQ